MWTVCGYFSLRSNCNHIKFINIFKETDLHFAELKLGPCIFVATEIGVSDVVGMFVIPDVSVTASNHSYFLGRLE